MRLSVFAVELASSFTIQSNFNLDGTGQSVLINRDGVNCFYSPTQADCTENLCPAGLVTHFAGSDIGNLLPNNAEPTKFCDNFYRDWYGPMSEVHFYCGTSEVRGIRGKYGTTPHQWGPTHGSDEAGQGLGFSDVFLRLVIKVLRRFNLAYNRRISEYPRIII